jgi:hypothetical protein
MSVFFSFFSPHQLIQALGFEPHDCFLQWRVVSSLPFQSEGLVGDMAFTIKHQKVDFT